jgi:hypothetical protein
LANGARLVISNNYELPGKITGDRREINLDLNVSPVWRVSTAYNHAALGNLDAITYNDTLEIGRWLSSEEYKMRSVYLSKTASANHIWRLGFEDYSGNFKMAGTIDIFGTGANFITGFYLYHANGFLNRRTIKYGCGWKKGNYKYKLGYAYSSGDAFFHADIGKRQLFTYTSTYDQSDSYDYSQHQLGLGLEKHISKNTVFQYSLFQTIPNLRKKNVAAAAPAAGAAEPVIKKKTRGGTLHLFSVKYLL